MIPLVIHVLLTLLFTQIHYRGIIFYNFLFFANLLYSLRLIPHIPLSSYGIFLTEEEEKELKLTFKLKHKKLNSKYSTKTSADNDAGDKNVSILDTADYMYPCFFFQIVLFFFFFF
jgi:hypothetical protein